MGWLRKRFGEKSTYSGLAILSALLAMVVGPEAAAIGAQTVAAGAAVYEIVRAE